MADLSPPRAARGLRSLLPLLLPTLVLQLLVVGTLIVGRDTLTLRDVLATHLPMKQAEAQALRQGELPELDVHRGGGQPLLGNANGAPFYPTTVLYLLASPLWALNAHFWIHFLIAPWSFAWLARRLGCGRAAAWVGGAVYTTGGWFLSQMSFYDLVPSAALAPAFIAACLAVRDAPRDATAPRASWRAAAAAGGLWALMLLGGDPAVAALALGAAVLAMLLARRRATPTVRYDGEIAKGDAGEQAATASLDGSRATASAAVASRFGLVARWLPLVLALAFGTAVALPQLVELMRVLPTSMRGERGYDATASTMGSWDPRQSIEQLLPLPFGRLDRAGRGGFWGQRFHTDMLPLFITLYPGLLPLALAAAAGRGRRRGGGFAWTVVALGIFVALGRFNPAMAALAALPGGAVVRFPVKAWLLVAIGLAALAAIGWERAIGEGDAAAARRLRVALLALGSVLLAGAVAAWLGAARLQAWMASVAPRTAPRGLVEGEALRWALTAAGLAALAAVLAWLLEKRAVAGVTDAAATLLEVEGKKIAPDAPARRTATSARVPLAFAAVAFALHVAVQLLVLAPATMTLARAALYERPPAFASLFPAGTRLTHGSSNRLFRTVRRRPAPRGEGRWLSRQGAAAGMPLVGVPLGWRYELSASPEGLDSFLTRLGLEAVKAVDDARRVRLLRVWGVEALLLERPLADDAQGVRLLTVAPGPLGATYVYRIEGSTPMVRRVAGVRLAADPRAATEVLLDPRFDPRGEVLLPPGNAPAAPGVGAARLLHESADEIAVANDGARDGWVVVQRAWQPHWRASVDGRPAEVVPADLHRLAVPVPAGSHEIQLWVDRRPLHRSALAAAAGLLGLAAIALLGAKRPQS